MEKITFDGTTVELDLDDRVIIRPGRDGHDYYLMFMPGLEQVVMISDSWQFDGDKKAPTFSPSLLTTGYEEKRSHCFIRGGRIEFLSDCSHNLRGQTVGLPRLRDWPKAERLW